MVATRDPDEFFALVDEHLTPHMLKLRYAVIGYYEMPDDMAVGYEASDDAAMAQVDPSDPLSADEVWAHFDPRSAVLNFHFGPPAALMARLSHGKERDLAVNPLTPLEQRLRLLGIALSDFVESLP